jgi:glutathione synthase/RimK-type ligase-like ATP-grasp enzyme
MFTTDKWINKPQAVSIAANKLLSLQAMQRAGVSIPPFTTSRDIAKAWLDDSYRVVARKILNGHSGQGIQVLFEGDEIPIAPLYTRYTKKEKEYRVHVFNGRVIDVTQKRRRNGGDDGEYGADRYVRNHANGWVYCRDNISPPACVTNEAIKAVQAMGLDFGAVDVGWRPDKAVVFEVNSAPGAEGSTLQAYVRELQKYL